MSQLAGYGRPFWLDLERPRFPQLETNLTTDIVIVGAGISGLKLAHALAQRGLSSVILEGAQVGEGASGRNQGTICVGANSTYAEAIAAFRPSCGTEARRFARDLWQLGVVNLELIKKQLAELEVRCDFQPEGFYQLVRRDSDGWEDQLSHYQDDVRLMIDDGLQAECLDRDTAVARGGNELYMGGLGYPQDCQFHSGKYVIGLAQGVCRSCHVRLFEQTRVLHMKPAGKGVDVITSRGTVSARHVFLLTNALVPQHIPALTDATRAERGQVLVTEPLAERPCRGSFGTTQAWWREIPEADGRFRLLFGGGRKRNEPDSLFRQFDGDGKPHPKLESEGFSPSEAHQQRLDVQFRALFPQLASARITHRWGGLQSFTADGLPLVGAFDPDRPIHGMAGFCGRGNTYSNVGAEFLAARVEGVKSIVEQQYGPLFDRLMAVNRPSARWPAWETPNA